MIHPYNPHRVFVVLSSLTVVFEVAWQQVVSDVCPISHWLQFDRLE